MGDEMKEIIYLSAEDLTAAGVASAKKNLAGLTGETEKMGRAGRLAFWGVGEAAENAAQQMGVPNRVARQLGNTVEGLAASFGRYSAIVGGTVLVLGTAATLWEKYRAAQERASQETIKAATASGQWIESALKEHAQTRELVAAKRQLAEAEFDINKIKMGAGISAQVNTVTELVERYNSAVTTMGRRSEIPLYMQQEYVAGLKLKLEEAVASLRKFRAEEALFTGANKGLVGRNLSEPSGVKSEITTRNLYESEAAYQAQLVELYKATGASKEEIWNQELLTFNTATAAKMANATSEQDYYDILAFREMERAAKVATYEKTLAEQVRQAKMNSVKQSVDNFGQAAQLMASMGGKHARQWFSAQKTAAIAQAVINTAEGATRALAQGGVYGALLMASVIALGAAQIAKIRSQEFEGGAGAMPAAPTQSTSWTGLPAQPQQTPQVNLVINVNGERVEIRELATEIMREIYVNHGSLGGLRVNVEQHA